MRMPLRRFAKPLARKTINLIASNGRVKTFFLSSLHRFPQLVSRLRLVARGQSGDAVSIYADIDKVLFGVPALSEQEQQILIQLKNRHEARHKELGTACE